MEATVDKDKSQPVSMKLLWDEQGGSSCSAWRFRQGSCTQNPCSASGANSCLSLSFQSMLFVEIPEYRNKHIRTAVKVNFYVINGKRKRSQPQHFTYHPGNPQGHSRLIPSARFDFLLCCFLAVLWGSKCCWFNSAQHSTAAGFKGCLWFVIRNFPHSEVFSWQCCPLHLVQFAKSSVGAGLVWDMMWPSKNHECCLLWRVQQ